MTTQAYAIGGSLHGQLVDNTGDEFTAETGEKYIRHEVRSVCGVVVTLFLLDGLHEGAIWDNVKFTLTVTKHFYTPCAKAQHCSSSSPFTDWLLSDKPAHKPQSVECVLNMPVEFGDSSHVMLTKTITLPFKPEHGWRLSPDYACPEVQYPLGAVTLESPFWNCESGQWICSVVPVFKCRSTDTLFYVFKDLFVCGWKPTHIKCCYPSDGSRLQQMIANASQFTGHSFGDDISVESTY